MQSALFFLTTEYCPLLSPVHFSSCCLSYSISLFLSPHLLLDIFHTHRCCPHIHPLQLHPKCIAVKCPSLHLYTPVTYGSRWPIICTGHPSSCCCHLPSGSSLPLVIPLGYVATFRDSSTLPVNMYRVLENINSISKSHICCSHLSYTQQQLCL